MSLRKGIIFDVQRSSMYDGPGIRTTVFFKGCPLSCLWCHNPESQECKPQLAYYEEKCTYCRRCAAVCPGNIHSFQSGKHTLSYECCTACGMCTSHCLGNALRIYGNTVTAEEIMEIVKQDKNYYYRSGGGLTISGGEPFLQYDFLLEVLKRAKEEKIHTCVETCGFTDTGRLVEAMPEIDLFLFDYKVTSPVLHKQYTGVDNKLIIKNLRLLYEYGKTIVLRCPIIPGYNDTEEHFSGIHAIELEMPGLTAIEIMPYHDMGKGKAVAIGKSYEVPIPTLNKEEKDKLRRQLYSSGCSMKTINSF
ncbi:MAG: glycyl-radical enzyme activating protein [Anaerocolumna sp.]